MNNPTTRDFLNAKRSKKPEMIMEGFERMTHDLKEAAYNLKVLTGWLQSMPDLVEGGYADLPDAAELRARVERYVRATDELTAQIVMNAEKIRALAPVYRKSV